jgi:nicotinate-nucleotide adenylyltransferase
VHHAHLRAALEAAEGGGSGPGDNGALCPAPPWQKLLGAGVDQRLEMLRLALEDNPLFEVSDLEARRGGPATPSDTLTET